MKQYFTCKRDDLIIRGRVFRHSDDVQPAFILCHGFMADSSMCTGYAELLAGNGYTAFTFDFCGGSLRGKSGGKTTDMSVLTEMEDLRAVIRYVQSLSFVQKDRISLLGCSQGGFVSALTAARIPEQIASLILLYPAFCIPDDARRGHMMFSRFDPGNIPEKMWCGPMRLGSCYVKDVIDMDPFEKIRGYDGPVLYLQGTGDRIVDVHYARRAVKEYPDCEYHEIEGAGHMFRGRYNDLAKRYIRDFTDS